MTSKRIEWLDFLKGFAILLVVLGHSGSISNPIVYLSLTISMPLFFSISGYLYKQQKSLYDYIILCYKKITSLLLPLFLYIIILFIITIFITHSLTIPLIKYVIREYGYDLWFLASLFLVFIFAGICDLLHINFYIQELLVIIPIIISSSFWTGIIHHNLIYLVYSYDVFFYIGFWMKKHINILKNMYTSRLIKYLSIILFLTYFIFQFNTTLQTDTITLINLPSKLLILFVAYLIVMNISHNAFFLYFVKYGKYTLIIYLIHFPVIALLSQNNINNVFIKFIVGWIVSIFVCYLASRIKAIKYMFYPRKIINKCLLKIKINIH